MVEDVGYSKGMLDAMDLAPTLGFTFGDDKKKLSSLFSVIEVDAIRGCLSPILRGRANFITWNAPFILRLKDVALVGSKAWCFSFAL
jgi:hypothetical protein